MNLRLLGLAVSVTAFASFVQAQQYKAPLAGDGHPDLQGFWANNNATPVERPKELANHPVLTDAEVQAMRKKAEEMFVSGKSDAAFGDQLFLTTWANVKGVKVGFTSTDGETGDYSSEWNDHRVWDNRTALITDPPDGRFPPMTARAMKIQEETIQARRRPAQGPEDRSFGERCITRGAPAIQAGYQSYFQIVQTSAAVMMMTEMFHDVRVFRLDGQPHPPAEVQGWMGDSRAHWEGNTLVVDTTNFKPRAFQNVSSEKLHVIERISRQDAETLRWEITIDDPLAWTKPWSMMIPLQRSAEPVYEYACHEGNIGLMGILAGARADEAKASTK
ncbi:MAG TPA: hypothetical protein VMH05_21300 [Bryobacteraceae bacterium]|nr:hypothetical protein [Bryobacteraceae bacterium]